MDSMQCSDGDTMVSAQLDMVASRDCVRGPLETRKLQCRGRGHVEEVNSGQSCSAVSSLGRVGIVVIEGGSPD